MICGFDEFALCYAMPKCSPASREREVFKQQIRRRRSSQVDLRASISQIPAARPELLHTTIGPYTLIEQIGAGSFGHVYSATKQDSDACYAVKVESTAVGVLSLKHEAQVCCALHGCRGVLDVHDFYETPGNYVMVVDRLGYSLKELWELTLGRKFTLKTLCVLAIEMV